MYLYFLDLGLESNRFLQLTFGASNLILAFPFTSVAESCMITASIVYAEDQP